MMYIRVLPAEVFAPRHGAPLYTLNSTFNYPQFESWAHEPTFERSPLLPRAPLHSGGRSGAQSGAHFYPLNLHHGTYVGSVQNGQFRALSGGGVFPQTTDNASRRRHRGAAQLQGPRRVRVPSVAFPAPAIDSPRRPGASLAKGAPGGV